MLDIDVELANNRVVITMRLPVLPPDKRIAVVVEVVHNCQAIRMMVVPQLIDSKLFD